MQTSFRVPVYLIIPSECTKLIFPVFESCDKHFSRTVDSVSETLLCTAGAAHTFAYYPHRACVLFNRFNVELN